MKTLGESAPIDADAKRRRSLAYTLGNYWDVHQRDCAAIRRARHKYGSKAARRKKIELFGSGWLPPGAASYVARARKRAAKGHR